MGFRTTDGQLYAVQLSPTGSVQIVAINNEGEIFGLGRPEGLPADLRFDAGDVSTDGDTMFIAFITVNQQVLYLLDLSAVPVLPAVTPVTIVGDTGDVHDVAYNPADGKLYGGDNTDGEIAVVDPVSGDRVDKPVPGLPTGVAFGAAWLDGVGHLFLYRNSGEIYEIADPGGTPALVDVQDAPSFSHLDGAARPQNRIAAALQMTASTTGYPATVTLDYVFENVGPDDLFGLSATDDLTRVFGFPNLDWTFTSISSNPPAFSNPAFDGHLETQLIAADQDLATGSSATVTVTLELLTHDVLADDEGYFCDQVQVEGATADGTLFGDVSTRGASPDPNADGSPGEHWRSCFGRQLPFVCGGEGLIVQDLDARLYEVVPASPIFGVDPIGGPTGREINNVGFRKTDGLLYGVELSPEGNVRIVQIDSTGKVFSLGRPPLLPPEPRFDAGDVSPDGETLYINTHAQPLYKLSLKTVPKLRAVTSVEITGATGHVFDWAAHPFDGLLYGGDSTGGQLAVLDPETGLRTDFGVPGLPSGVSFGAAWFGSSEHLFLYRNSGEIYEIDVSVPMLVDVQTGPGSSRNDAAVCVL